MFACGAFLDGALNARATLRPPHEASLHRAHAEQKPGTQKAQKVAKFAVEKL